MVCQGNWFVYFRFKLTKRVLGTVCLCVFCLKKVIVFYFNLAVSEERNKEKQTWMIYSECYSFSSITCRNTKSITKRKTAVSPLNQFKRSSKQRKSKWKKWESSLLTARHVTWGGGQRVVPLFITRDLLEVTNGEVNADVIETFIDSSEDDWSLSSFITVQIPLELWIYIYYQCSYWWHCASILLDEDEETIVDWLCDSHTEGSRCREVRRCRSELTSGVHLSQLLGKQF